MYILLKWLLAVKVLTTGEATWFPTSIIATELTSRIATIPLCSATKACVMDSTKRPQVIVMSPPTRAAAVQPGTASDWLHVSSDHSC